MSKPMPFALLVLLLLSGASFGASGQVLIRGDVEYWTYRSRVRVEMEKLTNLSDTTTERLRFRLWASEDPWRFFDRGRVIATGALPRLRPHETRRDVHRTVHLHYPRADWYYVTLTVEERTVDDQNNPTWEIRDVVEFGLDYLSRPFNPFWPF